MQTNSIFARWIYINRIFRHLWWIWYGFCIVPTGIFGWMWIFHWRITIGSSIKESGGVNAILGGKLKASIWVDWIILDRRMTILWVLNVTFFYGFYHSKSPWDSSVWGIFFVFFSNHLKQIKAIHHEFNHMNACFVQGQSDVNHLRRRQNKVELWGLFGHFVGKKTIQVGLNVMLTTLERCAWFLVVVDFVCCIMCLFFWDGNMSPFVNVWYI